MSLFNQLYANNDDLFSSELFSGDITTKRNAGEENIKAALTPPWGLFMNVFFYYQLIQIDLKKWKRSQI